MTTAGPQRQSLPHGTASSGHPPHPVGTTAEEMVTACGRHITVAPLCLGGAPGLFARIALDVGPERGGASRAWVGLSPQEARRLAFLLLEKATSAEREAHPQS